MRGFNYFNQILLSLSDVSSAFYVSIWNVYTFWHILFFNINSNIII